MDRRVTSPTWDLHLHVNRPLKSKGLYGLTRWVTIGLTAAFSGDFYTARRRFELPSNCEGTEHVLLSSHHSSDS